MVQDYSILISKDPRFQTTTVLIEKNIPRDFLDNLSNESSLLAQMAFSSANSGLDFSGLGFLYVENNTLAR